MIPFILIRGCVIFLLQPWLMNNFCLCFYDESPLCASAYMNYNQTNIISGKKDMIPLHYTATNKVHDPELSVMYCYLRLKTDYPAV